MTDYDEIRAVLRTFADRSNLLNQVEDALSELQRYGDVLTPALIDALSDSDDDIRLLVLRLFWELGSDAEPALPNLIRLLEDGNRLVRLAAAGVLGRFGKKAIRAIPILEKWSGSEDGFSHILALSSIVMIDPSKANAPLSLLINALELDGMEQLEAIAQLERLGEMAKAAVPSLKRLLHDDDSCVRLSAGDAIHRIAGDPTDAIKVGIDLLSHREWLQRYVGCENLQSLGPKAHSAIPRLQRAAQDDENDAVRNVAQAALSEIEA